MNSTSQTLGSAREDFSYFPGRIAPSEPATLIWLQPREDQPLLRRRAPMQGAQVELDKLLGVKLTRRTGDRVQAADLKGKTIGLYFSAHW